MGVVLALVAAGCGGGGMSIDGKVTNGGQPYTPSKDGDLNIGLTAEAGGKNYSGKAAEDGTFKIEKVPTGKYSVNVTRYPPMPADGKQPKAPPMAGTKKLDETWDVSSSSKSFTLDVAKLK
jgi:hypothetical protein